MSWKSGWRISAALWCLVAAGALRAQEAPRAPEISARSFAVYDVDAGQLLASSNMHEKVEVGALVHLMTAYLVFDALRAERLTLAQQLPVSERAARAPGARMFLAAGMKVSVEDLLKGMLVQSANDAATVLAEAVGGSVAHCIELMNAQAAMLEMTDTRYVTVAAGPAAQTTSAFDVAQLSLRLLQEFGEFLPFFGIRRYHYEAVTASNDINPNQLLFRDDRVDGMLASYSPDSGYGLAATASERGVGGAANRRLLAVVLGAPSPQHRSAGAQRLLNWGYASFRAVRLFEAGQPVIEVPVWKGSASTVGLGRSTAIVVAVPANVSGDLRLEVRRQEPLVAPLRKGERRGELEVKLGERSLSIVPLTVLETVEITGVFGQAWDAIRLWLK